MKKPEEKTTVTDPSVLSEFMNSLQRLFKIGIYYPTGHAILDQATERFMSQLVNLAADSHSVALRVFQNTIILQDVELSVEQPFVKDFNAMLTTLGISAVIFDRQISLEELHDFVRKMLMYRAKTISAKQFTQIEITNLPHSVTIELKEFLARKDARSSQNDDEADDLGSFIESLSKYGLSKNEIQQCKTLLESLPEKLAASNLDERDLPYASWDDVAGLLSRAIRNPDSQNLSGKTSAHSQSNISALASLLQNLGMETQDKNSREAINLLVRIIKKRSETTESIDSSETALRQFPNKPGVSLEKIQIFVDKKKLHASILKNIPDSSNDNEILSILMQIARTEQTLTAQIRIQQIFREYLAGTLTDKAWNILCRGLHLIIQEGQPARISAITKVLIEPLRRSVNNSSLALFHKTSALCTDEESKILWPHTVNEILVSGSGKDKLIYNELCQRAALLPHEQMVAFLPRLKTLDAFQETKIASDIFVAVSPSCYPLFAFLFKTDMERYIGERVIGGLKRSPKDWLIKAVAPLLDLKLQDHKLFLYSYLRQASQGILSDPIKNIAAKIIAETLSTLSQEKREEHWVENTISAMAQLPGDKTLELLRQISGGKKLLFMHQWPLQCRKAATAALSLRKR